METTNLKPTNYSVLHYGEFSEEGNTLKLYWYPTELDYNIDNNEQITELVAEMVQDYELGNPEYACPRCYLVNACPFSSPYSNYTESWYEDACIERPIIWKLKPQET